MADDAALQFPAPFRRICLVCQQPIKGYGYYTLYGSVTVECGPALPGHPYRVRLHGCGDPVHFVCPPWGCAPRTPINDEEVLIETGRRHIRSVAPGIDFNTRTDKYYARYDRPHFRKRLGVFDTLAAAQHARTAYITSLDAPRRTSKRAQRRAVRRARSAA